MTCITADLRPQNQTSQPDTVNRQWKFLFEQVHQEYRSRRCLTLWREIILSAR